MGEAELNSAAGELVIRSIFYFYGDAATQDLATQIAPIYKLTGTNRMRVLLSAKNLFSLRFDIQGFSDPRLKPETVWYNDDPKIEFFQA